MKLNIPAFSLAFGVWWGAAVFLLTWWLLLLGTEDGALATFRAGYVGYTVTPLGSLVGLVWGFVDGAIGGAALAWLYNVFVARFAAAA